MLQFDTAPPPPHCGRLTRSPFFTVDDHESFALTPVRHHIGLFDAAQVARAQAAFMRPLWRDFDFQPCADMRSQMRSLAHTSNGALYRCRRTRLDLALCRQRCRRAACARAALCRDGSQSIGPLITSVLRSLARRFALCRARATRRRCARRQRHFLARLARLCVCRAAVDRNVARPRCDRLQPRQRRALSRRPICRSPPMVSRGANTIRRIASSSIVGASATSGPTRTASLPPPNGCCSATTFSTRRPSTTDAT
jgi:hypothetical protein